MPRTPSAVTPTSGPPSSATIGPGTVLAGRYVLGQELGSGGMGTVWRARDLELDEEVAVKLLHEDLLRDLDALARFRREAKIARRIWHPNVARVFDLGEDAGRRYLTMELVDGRPLTDLLAREAPLAAVRVVDFALQTCAGLAAAHATGIVHRDLKPDNLLLTAAGRLVITDFGIAHARGGVRLTATHATLGTPAYMAPEQVESRPDIDARADIYALGAVMFEMLTGKPPWEGDSVYMVAAARVLEQPPDPRSRAEVDDRLAEVVLRCLARERQGRFEDVLALAAALRATPVAVAGAMSMQSSSVPAEQLRGPPPVVAVVARGAGELLSGVNELVLEALRASGAVWLRAWLPGVADGAGPTELALAARDAGAAAFLLLEREVGSEAPCPRAELRAAGSGEVLWAAPAEPSLGKIFAFAAAVAAGVAEAFDAAPTAPLPAGPVSPVEVERFLMAASLVASWSSAEDGARALVLLDASLRASPDDPWVNAACARTLLRRFVEGAGSGEDLAEALAMAELAVATAPELVSARSTLAEVLFELGRAEDAAAELRVLAVEQPLLAEPHLCAGRAWLVAGDAARAVAELERASELGAAPRARLDLAYAVELAGCGDGLALLEAADEGERSSWRYWLARVRIAAWRGRGTAALEQAQALGDRPIAHADAVRSFAACLAGVEPVHEARRRWSELAETAPKARRRRAALRALEAELLAARGARDMALSLLSLSGLGSDASDMLPLAWLERCPLLASLRAHPGYRVLRERLVMARRELQVSLPEPPVAG
ncbi:MAG: serine/threonine protein kinase [Myxococcales bacterium]|nr:serine/threonine protein kinase [Myxococcales bacterium]